MKIKSGDAVTIKKTGKKGIVVQSLPNPFFPDWLVSPNYLVLIDGCDEPNVFQKKELEK